MPHATSRDGVRLQRTRVHRDDAIAARELGGHAVAPVRKEAALERECAHGEAAVATVLDPRLDVACAGEREGNQVRVVAFLIEQARSVR